jgi:hypothetical protein
VYHERDCAGVQHDRPRISRLLAAPSPFDRSGGGVLTFDGIQIDVGDRSAVKQTN